MREFMIAKTKEKQPLVTVYMPTYNRVELLRRAVESVLKQDYMNIELIVVDDRSTDGTSKYLARMAKEDSRFKYFINEKNSGACVSRNKAIFAANGKFITGLDDDDYLLPHHISTFVNLWVEIKGNCSALYPNIYIKEKGGIRKVDKKIKYCKKEYLIASNWIGNQIFTKTSHLREIKGFDEKILAWQDIECWYRLLKHHDLKAYSTNKYSYVVDISHPHERISSGKVTSVFNAYTYFCEKHNLSFSKKKIMELQYNSYERKKSKLSSIVLRVLFLPKLYNIKSSLSIVRRYHCNNI